VSPAILLLAACTAQDWKAWGGDSGGARYSPLKQIHRGNITKLKPAWTLRTGDVSDGKGDWPVRSAFETTPLYIDGVLYLTTPFNRVMAVDGDTGQRLWVFDPKLDRERGYNLFTHRGVAFWTDGKRSRLLYGTLDGRLFSLDTKTGEPDPAFANQGSLNLKTGMAEGYENRAYGMTSPPAIYRNLVICGAWTYDGEPRGPSGDIRAFDVLTGELKWRFHTVPHPGEFGHDTWTKGDTENRGGVNSWSVASVDTQRGIVFLPLTSPAYDYYGGDRPGANLYGDSLLALDAATGKRLWHFQTVHHNIWDYDLPAQPSLVQVMRQGKLIDAVAQVTKTGFTFVFERATGRPLFDIVERPVPASPVEGEQASPTQPFPVKPAPFARQSMKREELASLYPEHRAYCEELVRNAKFAPLYTPIGNERTILFPGTNGGTNWGGASFDPETRTLYVNSMDVGMTFQMVKGREGAALPYRTQGSPAPNSRFWDPNLYPCQVPPWGHLTAISLDTGEFRWRAVLGEYDALTKRGIAPTGTPNLGGSLVTAGGLLFIAATNDGRFRAFDKDTGRQMWQTRLPASGFANPMTYTGKKSKKQFIVIAAGGGNKYSSEFSDALVAFSVE
jgi:glucose dehydrogenase